jgi:hypothetical protein
MDQTKNNLAKVLVIEKLENGYIDMAKNWNIFNPIRHGSGSKIFILYISHKVIWIIFFIEHII